MNHKALTAPCGIDCFNCEVYEKNITGEFQSFLAKTLNKTEAEIPCQGCRQSGCTIYPHKCATLECITEKGHDFCYECAEFPCEKLQPCKAGADKYPHNLKIYNLCRIQTIGIEKWAAEAKTIREKYFKGSFIPGTGPVLGKKE